MCLERLKWPPSKVGQKAGFHRLGRGERTDQMEIMAGAFKQSVVEGIHGLALVRAQSCQIVLKIQSVLDAAPATPQIVMSQRCGGRRFRLLGDGACCCLKLKGG